jgi:spore coat polysaccharide biosynthesis protein SpsF
VGGTLINVFVQARMGSSRLPCKMAEDLGGRPLLEWVLTRIKMARSVNGVFLLTSQRPENIVLVEIAESLGIESISGDEQDVASRFLNASQRWPAAHYVRVCADNPFICPNEIDRLASYHNAGEYDYSFNHIPKLSNNYVDGFGAEIFTSAMMVFLSMAELTPDEKEHVTTAFWNRRDTLKFGILPATAEVAFPELSFDIDTGEDLTKFKSIIPLIDIHATGAEILKILRASGDISRFVKSIK